jgi:hypothetical protein
MAQEKYPITSKIAYNSEPVFCRYHNGGCHSGGNEAPKNVIKKR